MNGVICKECNFDNDIAAKYCQNCGVRLIHKKTFKNYIKSLNFGSVAGAGAKGTSIAPLVGMELDKTNRQKEASLEAKVSKSHSLEDGSWYCPYCGKKNKQCDFSCNDCLREKP